MEDSTKQYRSGLLMGLTIAETLLLILFMLLLLFSAFFIKGKDDIEKTEKIIKNLKNENSRLADESNLYVELKRKIEVMRGGEFDDFFKKLQLTNKFESQIKALQVKNKEITDANEILENKNKATDKILQQYEPLLAEIKKNNPNEKNIIELTAKKIKNICEFEKSIGKGLEEVITNTKEIEKKNGDLNKQIVHLMAIQKGLGKGADYPPCWLDDQNKIEYIFNVVINDVGIEIFDIKNENRNEDKLKLPIQNLVYGIDITAEMFLSLLKPLFDVCVQENCRHFVRIYDKTTTKDTFKKNLLTVETYFYKYLTDSNFNGKFKITTNDSKVRSVGAIPRIKKNKDSSQSSKLGKDIHQIYDNTQEAI